MLTMPTRAPSSTTGMCRNRRSVMIRARSVTASPGEHVVIEVVMISSTRRSSSSAPDACNRRTTSRSETIPTSRPPSTTGRAPTLCSASSASSAVTVASGPTVATSFPLFRSMSTMRMPEPPLRRPLVHPRVRSVTGVRKPWRPDRVTLTADDDGDRVVLDRPVLPAHLAGGDLLEGAGVGDAEARRPVAGHARLAGRDGDGVRLGRVGPRPRGRGDLVALGAVEPHRERGGRPLGPDEHAGRAVVAELHVDRPADHRRLPPRRVAADVEAVLLVRPVGHT